MKRAVLAAIVLLAVVTARAEDAKVPAALVASEFSEHYTAAEFRLLKARLRQLEEKAAREERARKTAVAAVRKSIKHLRRREGIKCHGHFKKAQG